MERVFPNHPEYNESESERAFGERHGTLISGDASKQNVENLTIHKFVIGELQGKQQIDGISSYYYRNLPISDATFRLVIESLHQLVGVYLEDNTATVVVSYLFFPEDLKAAKTLPSL